MMFSVKKTLDEILVVSKRSREKYNFRLITMNGYNRGMRRVATWTIRWSQSLYLAGKA